MHFDFYEFYIRFFHREVTLLDCSHNDRLNFECHVYMKQDDKIKKFTQKSHVRLKTKGSKQMTQYI